MMSNNRVKISLTFLLLVVALWGCTKTNNENKKPNVLFIIVDDLRPELGCYGNENIISPNIDALAKDGYKFTHTYCQVPVCGASRASFLSGVRPNKTRFVDFDAWAEKDAPTAETLPMHFKKNGYITISNGKVFHHITDSEDSWSEKPWAPNTPWRNYLTKKNTVIAEKNKQEIHKAVAESYESADVDDYTYIDGKVVQKTIKDLKRLKKIGKPFFLAMGLRKPHLPFNHPKKYWDLYEGKNIPPADNPFIPENAPSASIHNSPELRVYTDIPKQGKISDKKAKELKHAYYACVSYADKLIGDVIGELKKIGLYDNTVIVLIGDHGYQLGEHTMWTKHTNYEISLNAPMIVRVPGMKKNIEITGLTEFVDIYPTLCQLAGINIPNTADGKSFLPLLSGKKNKITDATFSRFKNGESIRTERYLYTEYRDKKNQLYAKMLYDHKTDPEENTNVVDLPSNKEIVAKLAGILQKHRTRYY
jgi:arylsulfatase A-like enzyme